MTPSALDRLDQIATAMNDRRLAMFLEDPAPVIKNLRDYLAQTRCDALADRAALATERDRLVGLIEQARKEGR